MIDMVLLVDKFRTTVATYCFFFKVSPLSTANMEHLFKKATVATYLFIYSFIYLCIYSFIDLFIYLFIYLVS